MLRWILALLLIPFLDAVLLTVVVWQTGVIGPVAMVLLVVLTGLIGMLLVRAEGRRTMRKFQRSVVEGRSPTNELLDGALLIAAGAFLLTPGLVTDAIGFLLVIPVTRIPIRAAIKRFIVVPYMDKKTGGFATGNVWTFGFPDQGAPGGDPQGEGQGQGRGPGGATGSSWSGGSVFGPGSAGDSGTDDTVDLGEDDYTVDSGRSEGSYTIDFDDVSVEDRDRQRDSDQDRDKNGYSDGDR